WGTFAGFPVLWSLVEKRPIVPKSSAWGQAAPGAVGIFPVSAICPRPVNTLSTGFRSARRCYRCAFPATALQGVGGAAPVARQVDAFGISTCSTPQPHHSFFQSSFL